MNQYTASLVDSVVSFVPPCGQTYHARVISAENYDGVDLLRVAYVVPASSLTGTPEMEMVSLVSPFDVTPTRSFPRFGKALAAAMLGVLR